MKKLKIFPKMFIQIFSVLGKMCIRDRSYPRQPGRKPTFLIMEIDEEGQAHYAHGY